MEIREWEPSYAVREVGRFLRGTKLPIRQGDNSEITIRDLDQPEVVETFREAMCYLFANVNNMEQPLGEGFNLCELYFHQSQYIKSLITRDMLNKWMRSTIIDKQTNYGMMVAYYDVAEEWMADKELFNFIIRNEQE